MEPLITLETGLRTGSGNLALGGTSGKGLGHCMKTLRNLTWERGFSSLSVWVSTSISDPVLTPTPLSTQRAETLG